ncbi:MAG: hypothetical protein AAF604_08615 [Acidobacteriota bacterium]
MTAAEIRRFLAAETALQNRAAALHLLECEQCRKAAVEALGAGGGERSVLAKVLPYGRAVEKPAAPVGGDLKSRLHVAFQEVQGSSPLLDDLLAYSCDCWPMLIRNQAKYQNLGFAQRLIQEGLEEGYGELRRALALAEAGLQVLGTLESRHYGEVLLAETRGRGLSVLGNCHRLRGEFQQAEGCFAQAGELLSQAADPIEEGNFLYLRAILDKDRGNLDVALAGFEQAVQLFEEAGDELKVARVLTSIGNLHLDRACPEDALAPLLESLARSDEGADPRAVLYSRANLAICFADLGEFAEARNLFEQCREGFSRFADSYTVIRACWLEGVIASGFGEVEMAESRLKEAFEAYQQEEKLFDAALVALDLALVLNRQGRFSEVRDLARQSLAALVPAGVFKEAATALAFFHQAAHQEKVSEEVIRGVARFLRLAKTDPSLSIRT